VPHWPAQRDEVTRHQILAHMIAETRRHAGQADIVRELVDGAAGHRPDNDNMGSDDPAYRPRHHERLEQAAHDAGRG
jgi:hypothetical protein